MTQNNKKAPKKSLLSTLAVVVIAVLLLIGQQMGLLPTTEPDATVDPAIEQAVTADPGAEPESDTAAVTEQQPTAAPATQEPTAIPATQKPTATPTAQPEPTADPNAGQAAPITEPQAIVNYLATHDGQLPDNFVTKNEAQALGWDSSKNYLSDVAPGKSIGGDRFGNYEGLLPTAKGRTYREADCYYTGGPRNAYRLVFSNDGLYFYTDDHYNSFTELFPEE